jgi:hypothetical protein
MNFFRTKKHEASKIFNLSHYHLLHLNNDNYENEFLANVRMAKSVLDYDSFRKISEATLGNTQDTIDKRETNRYEDLLLKNPKKHETSEILNLSHYHLLNLNNDNYENEFLANVRMVKSVLDYDSFRKISEFTLEYTQNPRDKRDTRLPSSLETNKYEDLLLKNPKKRKQIFLKQHILFIDFVRKSYDSRSNDFPQHHFNSNIPENRFINEDRIDLEAGSTSLIITNYARIQIIPEFLQNSDIEEVTNEMTLFQSLTLIRSNIKVMKKIGLSNSELIVYIVTYFMFLQEILKLKDQLSAEEYKLLIDIIDETDILYLSVQVNLSNEKLVTENEKYKTAFYTANEQKNSYYNVLSRYDKIDIIFMDNSNPITNEHIINQILSDVNYTYELKNANNNYYIYSLNPNELMSIYRLLYDYYISNNNVFIPLLIIKPDGVKVDTPETHTHIIETKSTLWSYVFFKLYGPGVPFTKDRDQTVKSLIQLSIVNNIPLKLLLPKTNEVSH